jgi:copper(I)-binding protein
MNTRMLVSTVACCALVIVGAACGSSSSTPKADQTTTSTAAVKGGIEVTGAWARMSPAGAANGAAYMTLTAASDDKLLSASVDTGVAKKTEIHETVAAGAPMGSDDSNSSMPATSGPPMSSGSTMAGQMVMRPIASLDLPAGKAVELKPGGHHIMFIDLVAPLTVGTTLKVTLTFEHAAPMVVDVPVKEG